MKASDLRIGNYILDETGIITTIVSIDSERKFWHETMQKEFKATARLIMLDNFDWNTSYGCWVEKLKPIPLTEEWLLKFGFETNQTAYKIDNDKFIFELYFYDAWNLNYVEKSKFGNGSVELSGYWSVHQLQNLYFALTGEELELKTI